MKVLTTTYSRKWALDKWRSQLSFKFFIWNLFKKKTALLLSFVWFDFHTYRPSFFTRDDTGNIVANLLPNSTIAEFDSDDSVQYIESIAIKTRNKTTFIFQNIENTQNFSDKTQMLLWNSGKYWNGSTVCLMYLLSYRKSIVTVT